MNLAHGRHILTGVDGATIGWSQGRRNHKSWGWWGVMHPTFSNCSLCVLH